MAALTEAHIVELLAPYLDGLGLPIGTVDQLSLYVDLLIYWNARTNLSAVRDPTQIMQRQIGESLFCARLMPPSSTVLDFGSGAGFPGIPLQLLRADLQITLAESQGKKASFLREAVRVLQLPCRIWAARVEDLVSGGFDVVVMRAVDRTPRMLRVAEGQVSPAGSLVRFLAHQEGASMDGWEIDADLALPLSTGRVVRLRRHG